MVSFYQESDYDKLVPGNDGRWKFVARISNENAVCLISKILKQQYECRQMIRTKNSNSKGILEHASKKHNVDLDAILRKEKDGLAGSLDKFLTRGWGFNKFHKTKLCDKQFF